MRLHVPDPRDLLAVLERGADQVEALLGAVPRLVVLLDEAETLLARTSAAVTQVEATTRQAAGVVTRVGSVVDRAGAQVDRLTPLLDGLEPSLTELQPTLATLAETTHPREVAALVQLVDHLPELTARVEDDVLPVMTTLGTVAPDLHDLLTVSRELNDMLAQLPGVGRLRRRIDEEQGEDHTDATVRD